MAYINEHYLKLAAGYLFPEIGRRTRAFQAAHPDADVIRLGVGDVVRPLCRGDARPLGMRNGMRHPPFVSRPSGPSAGASGPRGRRRSRKGEERACAS